MIVAHTFSGKHVAVFGLGRTGVVTALSLQKGGAVVHGWDDNKDVREAARAQGVTLDYLNRADWTKIDYLVLSPGVPHELPKPHWTAKKANKFNVPIICDIEIFAREVAARAPERRPKVIAITGTNGKSTTTTLVGHIFRSCGRDAQIGGNIGRGVLDLDPIHRGAHYVLELSSYQLERTQSLKVDAAIFINLSADHLARHGTMENYQAAKTRIFDNQEKDDTAIIGVDDAYGKALCTRLRAQNGRHIIPVSGSRSLARGVCAVKDKLYDSRGRKCEVVADLSVAENLQGAHNHQNAAAAAAAALACGLARKKIGKALASFPGLAHRMEIIGRAGHVRFINDSKATNADAAGHSLRAFRDIFWIAGGQAKDGGIAPLSPFFDRVKKAYLIGESGPEFAKTLTDAGTDVKICGQLRSAILCAAKDALASSAQEPVILLAPACASFDQFKDFEARGDAFRAVSEEIIEIYAREQEGARMKGSAA